MAARRNKISNAFIEKAFRSTGTIKGTAKRVGMSYVGAARRLFKLGLADTLTARSR
jgi:molybdenum-dependent DNA-binding transcriptional regulator ModE